VVLQRFRKTQLSGANMPAIVNPTNGARLLRVSNASAIRVHAECRPATSIKWNISDHSLAAELGDTCTAPVSYNGTGEPPFPVWQDRCFPVDPVCINAINSSVPTPQAGSLQSPGQNPITLMFYANESAASAAFCYATWEMYTVTAELNLITGRLTRQVWNTSRVSGYFAGEDYVWAPNGCVCGARG
jgi:hypothetical protein